MGLEGEKIFEKPITDVIRARASVRSYKKEALTEDIKKKVQMFYSSIKGPFSAVVRFKLVEPEILRKESDIKLGTYGVIRGATSFVAAAVEKSENHMEQLGYALEKLILYIHSLGLGTCWLGGSFKKSEFSKAIGLKDNEVLPIVTPIGYPGTNKSLVDKLIRLSAGSKNRKTWNELFFNNDFSTRLTEQEAGLYSVPLEMVRLAPSASNKQPWRIVKNNDGFHFYLQHTVGYSKAFSYDIQKIDMGIAMCHFELTARESGLEGSWKVQEPDISKPSGSIEYTVSWIVE